MIAERALWYSPSKGSAYAPMSPIRESVSESIPSPICPIRPATRPAPKTMNTAMPLAVAVIATEPSTEIAAMSTTAPASESAGSTTRLGHQPVNAPVISRAPRKTTTV